VGNIQNGHFKDQTPTYPPSPLGRVLHPDCNTASGRMSAGGVGCRPRHSELLVVWLWQQLLSLSSLMVSWQHNFASFVHWAHRDEYFAPNVDYKTQWPCQLWSLKEHLGSCKTALAKVGLDMYSLSAAACTISPGDKVHTRTNMPYSKGKYGARISGHRSGPEY
jgi:hypothetical protein